MGEKGLFFEFEADFVESLRCIPMQVRYKLDICGIKLKLTDWQRFEAKERQALVELPCQTPQEIKDYRAVLQGLVLARTGGLPQDLAIAGPFPGTEATLPAVVEQQASSQGVSFNPEQWSSLTDLQRFALVKLSRSNHENRNLLPALREFGLL